MPEIHYEGDVAENGDTQPFRVAVRDGVDDAATSLLEKTPGIQIVDNPESSQGMLVRSATKFADIEAFNRHLLLCKIARIGVGMDNVNLDFASRHGIATINTPGASSEAVARRALAFMLEWSSRIGRATNSLKQGNWDKNSPKINPLDLTQKTLGIVGYGRIGKTLHRFSEPHVGRVLFSDIAPVNGKTDLSTLLQGSDIVSLHVGGDREILTPDLLRTMKADALLINTARGTTVNPEALLERMNNGMSVALDVFWKEGKGMFDDETLRQIIGHENFLGTPHTAASDPVTQEKLAREGAIRMQEFATNATINPHNLPGHTLPFFSMPERSEPGLRGYVSHKSKPGAIGTMGAIFGEKGINIAGMDNIEKTSGDHRLAVTAFDLSPDTNMDDARAAMKRIEEELKAYKMRLLSYV